MPIATEFSDILSALGVPVGAVGLAYGLVRGAAALEEDASDAALGYVSGLLTSGDITKLGRVGVALVPIIFEKVFGSKPLSLKFASRSILASTTFWIILLAIRHPIWRQVLPTYHGATFILLAAWYVVDWLSLVKAKAILKIMSRRYAVLSTLLFLSIDILLSYLIASLFLKVLYVTSNFLVFGTVDLYNTLIDFLSAGLVTGYFHQAGKQIDITDVMVPSTLLTSVWTLLFFSASIFTQLLVPIDYLRRFAVWGFRDVEKRPLTAIAKVAATLLLIIACVIKAIHWLA